MGRDDRARRAGPVRNLGNFASENGVVELEEEDTKESGGFFVRIRLELRINVDDEG